MAVRAGDFSRLERCMGHGQNLNRWLAFRNTLEDHDGGVSGSLGVDLVAYSSCPLQPEKALSPGYKEVM